VAETNAIAVALPAYGPWALITSDLPAGAPRAIARGQGAMAWAASRGRVEAERRGWASIGEHPARPVVITERSEGTVARHLLSVGMPSRTGATKVIEATEEILAFAPFGAVVADPIALVSSWPGEVARMEGTRRELLASLDADVNVGRALGRLGMRRRVVDRWLDARVTCETERGASFGGVHPGWLRMQGDRAVCLRCDRARGDGWRAVDLAGLALDPAIDLDALRVAHGEGEARDQALELAAVSVWTREHVIARDAALAARVVAILEAPPEPDEVRVWIDAPPFVDASAWCAPGETISSSRARWLLANVDGLDVGGGVVRVRTEPPIRRPRRAPPREDRAARRRRLFSRWDEGVEADDEGLVGATPEALAERIASGARGVVIDGTCGIGSLAIAYARQPAVTKVIAFDVDAGRLRMARQNARIYGVEDRIEFVRADIEERAGAIDGDLLVLDPPWGGRAYDRERVAIEDLGLDLAKVLARFRGPVALKLPRSFDPATLPGSGWALEALIDERGLLKMLIARRGDLS
jgi:trimethylguanosine synthase